jgi:UDP-3-O-[3-hydroxymyristoyl] N-acetylglucosamine deacetylase/3-hydroxyacyl-[acyl-carrier-protein] dehydratase
VNSQNGSSGSKRQHTIAREVRVTGRGLFTGLPVNLAFKPAPVGSGVTFVRSDQPGPIRIAANIENLTRRARRTALRNGTVSIETVEHCLAALRGMEIDNVIVELDNTEVPAADGSSQPFVEALETAGVVEQDAERDTLAVLAPVRVADGDSELVAWPGESELLEIIYELDYGPESPLGRQIQRFKLTSAEAFRREIAPARTFVTEPEALALRSAGLGAHLTYSDILVIGKDGPVENAYRFPDECVRHKILDLVGDLMLCGRFVCGHIYARKSGHNLNHELVRRLLEQHARRGLEQAVAAPAIDINRIQRILPHRYPMLLVDRVVEIDGDRRAVGIKNVTFNEPFFQGHYPRQPIMPGVLIIEAMAQLGGLLLSQKLEHTGKLAILLSLDNVKFRRPVTPGDQLVMEAIAKRVKSRTGEVACRAHVAGELAVEAEIRFMLVDADPNQASQNPP